MIFTTKGVWTTLQTSDKESEQEMCEKCDIVLMLIGSGNTGYREVVADVTPHKFAPNKKTNKSQTRQKTQNMQHLLQEAEEQRQFTNNPKSTRLSVLTPKVSSSNIIPGNGKLHNT